MIRPMIRPMTRAMTRPMMGGIPSLVDPGTRASNLLDLDARDIANTEAAALTAPWGPFLTTASTPKYYGTGMVGREPTVRFAAGNWLQAAAANAALAAWRSGPLTASFVTRTDIGTGQYRTLFCQTSSGSGDHRHWYMYDATRNGAGRFQNGLISGNCTRGIVQLLQCTWDFASTEKVYINGVLIETKTTTMPAADVAEYYLGSIGGFLHNFAGDMPKVYFDGKFLLDADAASDRNYLADRFRDRRATPLRSKTVCGDSRPAGFNLSAGEDWPSLFQAALGANYIVTNRGVAGRKSQDVLDSYLEEVITAESLGAPNHVFVQVGYNDFATLTAAQSVDILLAFDAKLAARGDKRCYFTEIGNGSGGRTPFINEMIARMPTITGQRLLSRADLNAKLGTGQNVNATYFQVDGLHLTATGQSTFNTELAVPASAILDSWD